MQKNLKTIAIAILTYNARHHLSFSLPFLLNSPLKPKILIVDSSSTDGTVEEAKTFGVETLVIPQETFNHGTTRELARKKLNTDIVIMMTQDAYPIDKEMIGTLVDPVITGKASIAYARQVPHNEKNFWESFPRAYNYPQKSHLRGIEDAQEFGPYLFFCSNSCAAYLNTALDEIGGFRRVLIGEDTCATAMLLKRGHKIAYVAEAVVKHSHSYTIKQEFHRYFNTGFARTEYREIIESGEKDESRGRDFLVQMTKHLAKEKPHLLPYGLVQTAAKWVGYRLGKACYRSPTWLKKMLGGKELGNYHKQKPKTGPSRNC